MGFWLDFGIHTPDKRKFRKVYWSNEKKKLSEVALTRKKREEP